MIFNSFKDIVDMPILPHSLRANPLKTNMISKKIKNELENFLVDICHEIKSFSSDSDISKGLKTFSKKFLRIQSHIREELPDKNGNMRLFPAEYIEAIYIVTFYCCKYLDMTQQQVASIFNLDKTDYKNRWGISPVADCNLLSMVYQYYLPIDQRKNYLSEIIAYIGKVSSELSLNYFICISNEMSLFSNLRNSNKAINRNEFKGRQFLFNLNNIDDIYKFAFYQNITDEFQNFKNLLRGLLDGKELIDKDEFLKFIINQGIEIKAENLKMPTGYVEFLDKYLIFKENMERKKEWQNVLDDLNEGNDYDYEDYSIEECEKRINDIDIENNFKINFLISKINLSSLITDDDITVLEYIVKKYEREFAEDANRIFREDKAIYCAKYFIKEYFAVNGVSKNSMLLLQDYIQTGEMGNYLRLCKNDYISALKEDKDIEDGTSVREKLLLIENQINKKKENRTVSRGLLFIDANAYDVTNEYLLELEEISPDFCIIVAGTKELKIEKQIKLDETYIYTNEEKFEK